MDENKVNNQDKKPATPEMKKPAPPEMKKPAPPAMKKEGEGADKNTDKKTDSKSSNKSVKKDEDKNKKLLAVIIPIIAVILVAAIVVTIVLIKRKDKGLEKDVPVVVTDEDGVAVTDENGVPVTYIPETEVVKVTNAEGKPVKDKDGKVVTTVVYKNEDVSVNVPVTDENGENVTNAKGENVTEQVVLPQKPEGNGGSVIMGTTAVPVTDGQGNTAVGPDGNVFTTVIEITSNPIKVDPAEINWKASMGGTEADYFSSIDSDNEGNFIAANVTNSKTGDMFKFSKLDIATPYTVLAKYDQNGNLKWSKALGSSKGLIVVTDVLSTSDGGFYAVGYGKDVGGVKGKGYYDGFLYKFDKNGNEVWHKIFGTSTVDLFNNGALTKDGGIVIVGSVGNNDGDAQGFGKPELNSAAVIVKFNSKGDVVWKNVVGGNMDSFKNVAVTRSGDIFCVGQFASGVLFKTVGAVDAGVSRFSSDGKLLGTTPIAGKGVETFTGITACKDGGVVVVGQSNSADVDSSESLFVSSLASRGGYDSYIIKIGSHGEMVFAKPFRGQYDDELVAVIEKPDGSFVATGKSNSSTRDFKGITTRGGYDIVIASFDKDGNLTWARSFGGTNDESANDICLSKKGGYVVAGRTLSKNIDMTGIAQYVNGKSVGVIAKFPE